jgi:putative lumazine-binding protein
MTSAIDLNDRAKSVVEDYDAIRDVVQLCLDGEATGDVEKLRTAFHEDARMFGSLAGERYDAPISELMEMSAKAPADTGQYRSRILSIQQTGDAALATVAEEGYWGTVSFIDYLSLARINDRWKIVSKLFAHTGVSHPTSGSARRRLGASVS